MSLSYGRVVTLVSGTNVIDDLPFIPNSMSAMLIRNHATDSYDGDGLANYDGQTITQAGRGGFRNGAGDVGVTVSSTNDLLAGAYWSGGLQTNFRGRVSGLGTSASIIVNVTGFNSALNTWYILFFR